MSLLAVVCDEDCFNCIYPDCVFDKETRTSIAFSRTLDKWCLDGRWREEQERKGVRYANAYYYANRESILARQRRYYWEHREERIDYQLRRYRRIRDVLLTYQIERYRRNRGSLIAYQLDRYYCHQDTLQSYQRDYYWFRKSFDPCWRRGGGVAK